MNTIEKLLLIPHSDLPIRSVISGALGLGIGLVKTITNLTFLWKNLTFAGGVPFLVSVISRLANGCIYKDNPKDRLSGTAFAKRNIFRFASKKSTLGTFFKTQKTAITLLLHFSSALLISMVISGFAPGIILYSGLTTTMGSMATDMVLGEWIHMDTFMNLLNAPSVP